MEETISFGQAWSYLAGTFSYWAWVIGIAVVGALGYYIIGRIAYKQNKNLDTPRLIWSVVFVLAFFCSIFGRPANVAANTTKENAKAGKYIGF